VPNVGDLANFLVVVSIIENALIAVAAIVGGFWALYRVRILRSLESGLRIDTAVICSPMENGRAVVFIDTVLENVGNRSLRAMQKNLVHGELRPLYPKPIGTMYEPVGLRIRMIDVERSPLDANSLVDWYESPLLSEVPDLSALPTHDIDLIPMYEWKKAGSVDVRFFMEPHEIYHLGTTLILQPGHYVGAAWFNGTRGPTEFWGRLFHFQVPSGQV
jgi:hypothetical protein